MLKPFAVMMLLMLSISPVFAERIQTRFGELSATEDMLSEAILLLNSQTIQPTVKSNNHFSFIKVFQIGTTDIVLLQDNGGTGCYAQYRFITLSSDDITVSPTFGSCSDLVKTRQNRQQIIVTMPVFRTYEEWLQMSKVERRRLEAQEAVYIYGNGIVYKNGRPIKQSEKLFSQNP